MMNNRKRIVYIVLSFFLILFGFCFGYYLIDTWSFHYFDFIMLLYYIPTFLFAAVGPVVVGFLCFKSIIKKE